MDELSVKDSTKWSYSYLKQSSNTIKFSFQDLILQNNGFCSRLPDFKFKFLPKM